MITETLELNEIALAGYVGLQRKLYAREKSLGNNNGMDAWDWSAEIDGACGELAVAKHLGMYWNGTIAETDKPDVGPYEVRTNCSRGLTDMILRPGKVHRHRVYISALAFPPRFQIMGWIWGRDGMNDDWKRDGGLARPEAWFIPCRALQPMATLPSAKELVA